MTKGLYLIVSVVALVLGARARGFTGFLVAGLIVGIPYYVSLRLHPRTRHIGLFGLWGVRGDGGGAGEPAAVGAPALPGVR